MSEQPLDLKGFLSLVWRRRFLVAGIAALGFAGGVAHQVLLPPLPKADALVVIPPSALTAPSGASVPTAATQVIIATSTPVLAAAGAAVSPPISATALRSHVAVTAPSPGVLQFQVSAPQAAEAEKLANAEVTNYIAYINKTGSSASGGVLPALQQEASQLSNQIQNLQGQINSATSHLAADGATSSAGQRDASLISSLRTEQEEVSLQLNNVNNQIVNAQLSGTLSAGATRVLQNAAIVPTSKTQLVLYPAMGAAAGLFGGCLFVFFRSRRDRRLLLRDEMAAAIGLPVLASLESSSCKSTKDWRRLLEQYRPSPVDSWSLRRLLHRLAPTDTEQGAQLRLLAFADDGPAIAVGVRLAKSATELGISTELAPGEQPSLALLRAACTVLGGPATTDAGFKFEAKYTGAEFSSQHLTLSVVAVDETEPAVPLFSGATLLAVSSGFATAETLARVALAASDAGHAIDGLVVVNPEASDNTAGVVPSPGDPRPIAHYAAHRPGTERPAGFPS